MRAIRQMVFCMLLGIAVLGAAGVQAQTSMGQNTWTLDLGGGVSMDFVLIQPGTFMMGSTNGGDASPPHMVVLTKPFYIGKYKVTEEQYQQVMGYDPCSPSVPSNPVWSGINRTYPPTPDFCTNLTAWYGVTARLPTEAEWEYSARAGTTTEWCFGSSEYVNGTNMLAQYAWYSANSGDSIHPVGQLKPNQWGLYDMYGDVWEFVRDGGGANGWSYDASTYNLNGSVTNPCMLTGHHWEIRGGAYYYSADTCNSYCRGGAGYPPIPNGGFRVVVECPSNMLAAVSNDCASNIAIVSATLNGQLLSTGTSATAVSVYWGVADNGTNTFGWNHVVNLGQCPAGPVSANVTGLTEGSTYYYRFCASNLAGMVWADPAARFKTVATPTIDNGSGATSITPITAQLNGNFTAGGNANVTVYWGTTDGGTTASNWQHANNLGAMSEGAFFCNISGLNAGTTYRYRCYATNAAGTAWAGSTASFQTAPLLGNGSALGMKIMFTGYSKTETLTNFPVLVVLETNIPNFAYNEFQSPNGWDLSFAASNQITPLNYEIERWNTNGTSYVWVQVPKISSSNDYIWAYWGNPTAAGQALPCTTNGSTWGSNYRGVWHFDETAVLAQTNALHFDSTANGLTGVQGGNASANGVVCGGQYFDGNSRYIDITNATSPALDMGNSFTFSAWLTFDGSSVINGSEPVSRRMGIGDANGWELALPNNTSIEMYGSSGSISATAPSLVPSWTSHVWYYIAVVANGASVSFYRNGVLQTTSGTVAPVVDNNAKLTFGYNAGHNNGPWNGRIDEARIQQGTASSNWLWACWINMASNSAFSSYQIQSGSTSTAATVHGIPYSWLQSYGITNTSDSVETQHLGGSSLNVLQNYIAGMNPTNPNSRFAVGITNSAGQIVVRMPSVQATDGKTRYYDVERRTNLISGSWQPIPGYTNIPGNGSLISCTNALQNQSAFYRAKVWLQ